MPQDSRPQTPRRLTLTIGEDLSMRLVREAKTRGETVAAYAKSLLTEGCFQRVIEAFERRLSTVEKRVASVEGKHKDG